MVGNVIAGLLAGGAAVGDFESIATVTVGAGGSSTISFTSIVGTYQHLQLRILARDNRAPNSSNNMTLRINSDTGSNYAQHILYGDGASAASYGAASQTYGYGGIIASSAANTSVFGTSVIDFLDYANTSKNKTIRVLSGFDNNGSGSMRLYSNLWNSTAAITSITLDSETSGDFVQYSHFALYGIKG